MDDLSKLAHRERARLVSKTTASGNVSKEDFEALDRFDEQSFDLVVQPDELYSFRSIETVE